VGGNAVSINFSVAALVVVAVETNCHMFFIGRYQSTDDFS
jgi:hypothetical protein